ncbi:unnamed protein product [Sphagnum balticum]
MDLEAWSLPPTQKATLLAKLREYKSKLNKLKREFKKVSSAQDPVASRNELMADHVRHQPQGSSLPSIPLPPLHHHHTGSRPHPPFPPHLTITMDLLLLLLLLLLLQITNITDHHHHHLLTILPHPIILLHPQCSLATPYASAPRRSSFQPTSTTSYGPSCSSSSSYVFASLSSTSPSLAPSIIAQTVSPSISPCTKASFFTE